MRHIRGVTWRGPKRPLHPSNAVAYAKLSKKQNINLHKHGAVGFYFLENFYALFERCIEFVVGCV